MVRFEREIRYYELRLQQDLFGWVVVKAWGRKSTDSARCGPLPAAVIPRLPVRRTRESAVAIVKGTS